MKIFTAVKQNPYAYKRSQVHAQEGVGGSMAWWIVASEKIQNSQESSGLDYLNASLINEDFADKNISSKGKYLCSTIDKEGLPHNHV
ncbi:unnamed protein product [Sphagnum jensenii]